MSEWPTVPDPHHWNQFERDPNDSEAPEPDEEEESSLGDEMESGLPKDFMGRISPLKLDQTESACDWIDTIFSRDADKQFEHVPASYQDWIDSRNEE